MKLISWILRHTVEWLDDILDPDWKPKYDPFEDRINNPTPRQVEKLNAKYTLPKG